MTQDLSVSVRHGFAGFALDASFVAGAGVTALFGRSGSGKTTIVNAVAGLLRPDHGRITLGDEVLMDSARGLFLPPHRRRIGYVFQDARLFPHLSVRQNLCYGQWLARGGWRGIWRRGGGDNRELHRIVDLLGLGHLLDRRPAGLSGGEKSRVALGRAILSEPRLLLMDEPLAALDEARKAEILPYFERLRDDLGLPILYVSHSVAEVARLAGTVVMIEGGRVMAAGPAASLLSDPAMAPGLGLRSAGALLAARVLGHDDDGLTRLDGGGGTLWLPRIAAPPGTPLRLRILAQDVTLALDRPQGLSALNILPAVIRDIRPGEGPGALVQLRLGDETILARVTRRSVAAMGLTPGLPVFAVLKALSVSQENIGHG